MAMHEEDIERICRQGTQAWQRLKKDKNWNDWLKVGEAHLVGREWAMRVADTNRPQGKAYNMTFGEWLAKYKFDDMDKGDRSRLFAVMDNLPQIEEWRKTLTLTERLKLNHPNAVLRKWKAYMAPEPRTETGEPKPTLRDSVVNLSEQLAAKDREISELKDHIAELEAARETRAPATEAQPAPRAAPAKPARSRDPLDLKPSNEANRVARKVYDFGTRFSRVLAPWFQRDLSPDDREIIRHALNHAVDLFGTWSTELWLDEEESVT